MSTEASECQFVPSVILYERMLVEVLVTGLHEVGLGFQIVVFRLVELSDGGLAVLVFGLHQLKGILRTLHSFF